MVTWGSHQIRWRNLGKITKELELAILLAGNVACLSQGRAIVVGGVSARVTKVAPVGTTEYL